MEESTTQEHHQQIIQTENDKLNFTSTAVAQIQTLNQGQSAISDINNDINEEIEKLAVEIFDDRQKNYQLHVQLISNNLMKITLNVFDFTEEKYQAYYRQISPDDHKKELAFIYKDLRELYDDCFVNKGYSVDFGKILIKYRVSKQLKQEDKAYEMILQNKQQEREKMFSIAFDHLKQNYKQSQTKIQQLTEKQNKRDIEETTTFVQLLQFKDFKEGNDTMYANYLYQKLQLLINKEKDNPCEQIRKLTIQFHKWCRDNKVGIVKYSEKDKWISNNIRFHHCNLYFYFFSLNIKQIFKKKNKGLQIKHFLSQLINISQIQSTFNFNQKRMEYFRSQGNFLSFCKSFRVKISNVNAQIKFMNLGYVAINEFPKQGNINQSGFGYNNGSINYNSQNEYYILEVSDETKQYTIYKGRQFYRRGQIHFQDQKYLVREIHFIANGSSQLKCKFQLI